MSQYHLLQKAAIMPALAERRPRVTRAVLAAVVFLLHFVRY
ncbi:hypothetical protein ALQ31_100936 [Pseudomonas amygdali pv. morsprunorum]|uniref:Uncharacterized protein n=1 Tax=Pseudomonas savastanoi TaxID=29438 RepID=A0A3M6ACR1_PSESS|nr:hypothetical protein ALO74_102930 [Pseudomonas syringae pv. cunninghamiae]RMO17767.1 hypothetical protein ALQ45_102690 [Pseudomonas amygdali pv. morsprunorum]RMV10337.1 hypothetical protein ALP17_111865 [Pseudomonas savastanoi]RMP01851.1 hypothetical protein ALQ31_100936 [Pseudomonas amygdali pv. morsprunorum]RMU31118.1 hypothetical protein ALP31_103314 [Pseudomonas amygdali pv. morsprunorum]